MSIKNYDSLTMEELQRLGGAGDMEAIHALGRRIKLDEYKEEIIQMEESLENLLSLPPSGLKIDGHSDFAIRELQKIRTHLHRLKYLLRS